MSNASSDMIIAERIAGDLGAVERAFPRLKYMKPAEAEFLRELITKHALDNLLELGTYHGKGTAYMALIQEGRGRGHITTLDLFDCLNTEPTVHQVLSTLGLERFATVRLTGRSFTHTLMQMLEENPQPKFDFAYIDGAHTWDGSGFAFFLVDIMLRPGGWIIFDDLDWTMKQSDERRAKRAVPQTKPFYPEYPEEERLIPQVRKVWELLVPKARYINRSEYGKWGIAQKPLS